MRTHRLFSVVIIALIAMVISSCTPETSVGPSQTPIVRYVPDSTNVGIPGYDIDNVEIDQTLITK